VVCEALLAHGARVTANDIAEPEVAGSRLPVSDRLTYVPGDVTDPSRAVGLLDQAGAVAAVTDVCLLAGRVHSAPILEQTPQQVRDVLALNVEGALYPAQEAARRWRAAGTAGNLVFISSWVQAVPWPGIAPYAASKAALQSLARSFARELAPSAIRANVIAPGIVAAGMALQQWEDDPQYRQRAQTAVPLGYLQPPQSVADAVIFLCSPLASYMTGATVVVDGGASLYPMAPDEVAHSPGGPS